MECKKKESVLKVTNLRFSLCSLCLVLLLLCGIFFITLGPLIFVYILPLRDYLIDARLPLTSSSEVSQLWLHPPIKPHLKIYIFNVTNPGEYLRGGKPKLDEVGPYVYEEKWEKIHAKWSGNDTRVEYEQKKTYFFRGDASMGSQEDTLIVPNVPMIAAISKLRTSPALIKMALKSILQLFKQKPFVKLSVREFLWGYENPLIKLGNEILPKSERIPFDKFGILVGKNGSTAGALKINTGLEDLSRLGEILSFKGKNKLDKWSGEDCNTIRGTDGTIFPSRLKKEDMIHVFSPDLCQSLPLVFQKEVTSQGIPGYRFIPPSNVFYGPEKNPRNKCFCDEKKNLCMVNDGLLNVAPCQFNSPIVISWPHFYQANPNILKDFEGLAPDPEKHQFFIDIQNRLGSGLRAAVRSQINVEITPMKGHDSGLRKGFFPLIWVDEGLDEIKNEDTLRLLKMAVNYPLVIRDYASPAITSFGILLLVLSLFYLYVQRRHRRRVEPQNNTSNKEP
eukprot:TRINITY_DN3248_c0_g1_i2.p1 TRINITY_DN3248_c0_g1~~TRINITY_DN3248_c0_g1_i2.p1  ORF type:complete len:506 (-),score=107.11 TRINITY_DN3248_c0_g1_i2:53-1570(-)